MWPNACQTLLLHFRAGSSRRGEERVGSRRVMGSAFNAVYEPAARFPGFGASADGERKGRGEEDLATEGKKEGKKGGRKRETDEHCASG